jgi:hypothetical protein
MLIAFSESELSICDKSDRRREEGGKLRKEKDGIPLQLKCLK